MGRRIVFFLIIALSLFGSMSVAFAEGDELTLEQISETEAAKFYISKQYNRALLEFKRLEEEHPKSTLIKRYIASAYENLRKWDEAIAKLKEIIGMDAADVVARRMLGENYVKNADLDKAIAEYEYLLKNFPDSPVATSIPRKIEEIQRLKNASKVTVAGRMPPQEFMKSAPTQAFSKGKYKEALEGFSSLQSKYPEDLLILRFKAIALTRLKRYEEAEATFQEILAVDPNNVATHFYLGQTYAAQEKMEEARTEYRWVMENDETSYQVRAQRALFQTLKRSARATKPWSISVANSYEYDTNATFKPRDNHFTTASDQNSGRYTTTASGTYRFVQKGKVSMTADALYSQSLYDDFQRLQTFTSGAGVSLLYAMNLFKRPLYINVREGMTHTILRDKFFVFVNTLSTSFIFVPHKILKSTVTHRYSWSNYDASGSDPDRTNRDGHTNAVSLSNTLYMNDARTLSATAGYDYKYVNSKGINNRESEHGAKLKLNFPIFEKVEGAVEYRFQNSKFPKTTLPLKRNDTLNSIKVEISRIFFKYFTLMGFYKFEDVNARNNIYEYRKQVLGTRLTYRY